MGGSRTKPVAATECRVRRAFETQMAHSKSNQPEFLRPGGWQAAIQDRRVFWTAAGGNPG